MNKIAKKVMSAHRDLHLLQDMEVRFVYLQCDKEKVSSGKTVYGECRKVTDVYKALVPYDFIIVFYPAADAMTDKQKEILMYHEMLHAGVDENGNMTIIPHDVEDFRVILDRYGLDWAGGHDGTKP